MAFLLLLEVDRLGQMQARVCSHCKPRFVLQLLLTPLSKQNFCLGFHLCVSLIIGINTYLTF